MKNNIILLTVTCILFCMFSCEKANIRDQQTGPQQSSTSKNSIANFKKNGLSVGDHYGGGIIFHLDATGEHGLIACTKDLGDAPWGCSGILMPGTLWDLGTGSQNTDIILGYCNEEGIAAKICHDLVVREIPSGKSPNQNSDKEVGKKYDDWYLPSSDEIASLLSVSFTLNDPELNKLFPTGSYWSSCQGPLFWHEASPLDPSQTAFTWFHYDKIDLPSINYIIPQPAGRGALVKVRAIRSF